MSHPIRSAGLVAAGLLLALTACGDSDDRSAGADRGDQRAEPAAAAGSDVPAECAEAYPSAVGPADLADVTLRPESLPEPPVEGTLCQTSSTLDDTITTADYATGASPTEVLDAYELQLGSVYEVVRVDDGAGETLTGDLGGGVFFQVTPAEGRYSIAFGTEGSS